MCGDSVASAMARMSRQDLLKEYRIRRRKIQSRLRDFTQLGKTASEAHLFAELAFCLLTPQTSARRCDSAVKELVRTRLLFRGGVEPIARVLHRQVRFHNHKARYIVETRALLTRNRKLRVRERLVGEPAEIREWLLAEVPGFGLKEATHFMRNVGRSGDLAILDRHILRNMVRYGAMARMPASLSRRTYAIVERKFQTFAAELDLPPAALDLLLWSQGTGEIFK